MELKDIRNIGPKALDVFHANQIYTPRDLVLCFPKKYHIYKVDNEHAFSGEMVCFQCKIVSRPIWIKSKGHSKAYVFYVLLNQNKYKCIIFSGDFLKYKLQLNIDIICYGKWREREKEFSVTNIFFDLFECKIELDYGFKQLKNKVINNAILNCLNGGFVIEETLPLELIKKYRLLTMQELILKAHFPSSVADCIAIKRRVRYEDFFWYAVHLEVLRLARGFDQKSPKLMDWEYLHKVEQDLPYSLTEDQKKAVEAIYEDLSKPKLMNRLIEGDVGCGKSIVAFLATIATIHAGYQVALMAPTEILAQQHLASFQALFPNVQVDLLTSSCKEKDRQDILYRLVHQRIDLLIGTHALIEESVIFSKLGLVIIDEQHRFGVNQRKALVDKFHQVDALFMTATPIPRTLGLTMFGDLDLTRIQQMPKNRKPVITEIISFDSFYKLGKILLRHLALEEQIYIVVPLIEENEMFDYIDIHKANDMFHELLPDARMAILHGKMKLKEKEEIMSAFKRHELDCLISTTVIEVGVDVKNATVMVILDAERYGLSQLHQLRGRVGRGDKQSYCYLVSRNEDVKRLAILKRTSDGFLLAEEDFKLRGPGDYLGEDQSGFGSLNFDFASKDVAIWKCALEDSKAYVAKYLNHEIEDSRLDRIMEQAQSKKTKIN